MEQTTNLELRVFDVLEAEAHRVAVVYFESRGMDDFVKRLKEGRFTGVGSQRLLLNTLYRLLDGDVERLVDFYEQSRRPDDDPHYEDLVTTILLGIITGFATNIVWRGVEGSRKSSAAIKAMTRRVRDGVLTLEFLLEAAALRSRHWSHAISKEKHDEMLAMAKKDWRTALARDQAAAEGAETESGQETVDSVVTLIRSELDKNPKLAETFLKLLEETNDRSFGD